MGQLDDMFSMQRALLGRLYGTVDKDLLPITVTAIVGEVGEILEEYQDWKPWRNKPPMYNPEHLLEEVVDLWHFIIDLTLELGFDEEDVYEAFVEKNKVNHERQDRGY